MKQRELLNGAISALRSAGVTDPSRDARKMLRFLLKDSQGSLDPEARVNPAIVEKYNAMVGERLQHRPVAQILGEREFWGRAFKVTGDTLDPRAESEQLIDTALRVTQPQSILDLGTGTGCLLLSLLGERPGAVGTGTDISDAALCVARRNAQDLGFGARVSFLKSNWFDDVSGLFDLIVCNPPYISARELAQLEPDVRDWEPHLALTPGEDGLAAYKAIAREAGGFLLPGGYIVFEVGQSQAQQVADILDRARFEIMAIDKDLNGIDRVVAARWMQ